MNLASTIAWLDNYTACNPDLNTALHKMHTHPYISKWTYRIVSIDTDSQPVTGDFHYLDTWFTVNGVERYMETAEQLLCLFEHSQTTLKQFTHQYLYPLVVPKYWRYLGRWYAGHERVYYTAFAVSDAGDHIKWLIEHN